jgi:hypothetical protein
MPCIQRMHKARGKLSAREVLDVIRRQHKSAVLSGRYSNTAQKRVAREVLSRGGAEIDRFRGGAHEPQYATDATRRPVLDL